jgi:choline kinase
MSAPVFILLAAGRGSRMNALTADMPKVLLAPPGGESLLARNLRHIALVPPGGPSIVVAGYRADKIHAFAQDHAHWPVDVVENMDFATTGPLHSLCLALDRAAGRDHLVIGNGDTVFAPSFMAQAGREPEGITLFGSEVPASREDDLIIRLSSGDTVAEAGKNIAASAAVISAGLVAVRGAVAVERFRAAVDAALSLEKAQGRLVVWHTVFAALGAAGAGARLGRAPREWWDEFDTQDHLSAYAKTAV